MYKRKEESRNTVQPEIPTVCKEKMSSKNKQTQNWQTTKFVDMNHNNRIYYYDLCQMIMNKFKILSIIPF